jgi:hypothetical protein
MAACTCPCAAYGDHEGACTHEATTERQGPMRINMELCQPCADAWDRRKVPLGQNKG